MSTGFCPNCGNPYPPGQFACLNCHHQSFDDGNPYASPPPGPSGPIPGMYDLKEVASKQRLLVLAVGCMLILYAINIGINLSMTGAMAARQNAPDAAQPVEIEPAIALLSMVTSMLSLGVIIFSIVALLMLAASLHYGIASRILFAVLMFCPCVNIIVMLVVNGQATKILTQNGISVGFFGADMRQFDRRTGF